MHLVGTALAVTGFTSSTGNPKVNQQLSLKRAMEVAVVLEEAGIRRDTVQVLGRGALDPIADNATRDGREKNRRVEIQVHVVDPNVETRKHIVPQS
jgi:OOP family OmpA-OmpF porin